MQLTIKQTKALDYLEDNITTEVLFGGGAGGGKSALGCYWLLKAALKYPGTRWVMGRSELKTLKETTLVSFFEVCKMQEVKADVHYKFNHQSSAINLFNGSTILLKDLYAYPSDPNFDSLGSLEITGAFIDECNQITEKAKNIVKSRIRFKLDENKLIPKLLMTCNPAKNWVYGSFYRPAKDKSLGPNKQFIQSLVTDNPFISAHYRENLLTLDKTSKERLLFGNWEYDDDPAALIEYDRIMDLFTNSYVSEGNRFITADIARFGRDSTVIIVWMGWRAERIIQLKGSSVTEVAAKIEQLRNQYRISTSAIIVDEDGVGGGVMDILACPGFVNNSSPLEIEFGKSENYSNLKSQCYFKLAEKVNAGEIFINCQDIEVRAAIVEELEQVKQKDYDKDSKRAIISKDKVKEIIGRSPDFSDALMMRIYFDLQPQYAVAVA